MEIIVKNFSRFVIGYMSPYPTVVIVANAQYSDAIYYSSTGASCSSNSLSQQSLYSGSSFDPMAKKMQASQWPTKITKTTTLKRLRVAIRVGFMIISSILYKICFSLKTRRSLKNLRNLASFISLRSYGVLSIASWSAFVMSPILSSISGLISKL